MFPDEALANLLLLFTEGEDFALEYHLYKNNYTPDNDTASDLTDFVESDFPGYAVISGINEPDPAINAGHEAHVDGNELTWTRGAGAGDPQQAFGMYLTYYNQVLDEVTLLCAWRFDEPTTIAFAGDKVRKKVNLYAKNYNP